MKARARMLWTLPAGLAAVPAFHVAHATQYMSVDEAQKAAFADAAGFDPMPALDPGVASALGVPGWSPGIWRVRGKDRPLGWFFVDRVIGKSEIITYAVALDESGAIRSVEILDYRESHGGEIRLPFWRKQFIGKTASDAVQLDHDIKNISGATLSSRHVTEGVHRLLQVYERTLKNASPAE
jgi:hypothetical protein